MKIVCDNCSTKYSIADEKVRGKVFKIKCKKCSHIIVVKGDVAPEGQAGGFDQKDTRVFDYSGFDGGHDGGAAAAQDAIWHLVIDREQVGPLTIAEVQAKVTGGEADAETYVWREGFGDWQRLGSVEELAGLARPREEAGDDRALFGKTGPADLFGAAKTEEVPAGLFAGAATAEKRPASPEPVVFSSTGRTQKPAKEDLFGPADAMAAAPGEGGGRAMTAQRNENSVLFSLNNLASLATDSPKPTASAGGGGGGAASSSSGIMGSTTEGSGLIDIRAMAAMTLGGGGKKEERAMPAASNDDDLPVFSASAFSAPASGVLLPTVTSAPSGNRMIYVLVGFVAVLALAAIGLVVFILAGKKDVVAVAPPVETPREPSATPTPAPPPTKQAGVVPTPPPEAQPPVAQPPAAQPPAAQPPTATPAPGKLPEKKPEKKPSDKPKEVAKAPDKPKEDKPDEPAAAPPPSAKAPKCDEVACLVTPDLPCCPKKGGDKPKEVAASGNLPEQLDQPDIIVGMKGVSGKVTGCNDTYRVAGAFKIKVTVGPDGNVTAATAQPPMAGTPTGSCVEKAVRAAKFKKTKRAITFNYPYNFR